MQTPSTPPQPSLRALLTLTASAAASAALALYQWSELFAIRAGATAACSINETVNCAAVWNLAFASKLHQWFGMPVAGLGLVWASTALVLAGLLRWRARTNRDLAVIIGAVRLTAIAGVLACVTLASASYSSGVVCLTCLGTYALVVIYAVGAFGLLPGPTFSTETLTASVAWAVVVAVPVFLALLWPGQRTPKGVEAKIEAHTAASDAELVRYLETMPQAEKQFTAYARQQWLKAVKPEAPAPAPRTRLGPATAPVAIVEFTDILCSHCKQLELTLTELRRVLPEGRLSIEPRYFPLDGECNSKVTKVWGDGIRCLAAKVQVCLEGSPALWAVKHELFEKQQTLSQELILDIATSQAGMSPEALRSCVAAPSTQAKIDEDVEYAIKYGIQGTPLVLLNGKETPPSGPFILAMAMYRADAHAPFFTTLPMPSAPAE